MSVTNIELVFRQLTYFGRQHNDLLPSSTAARTALNLSQLARHRPNNPCAQHFTFVVQQNRGTIVEPNNASIWPLSGLLHAYNNCSSYIALADFLNVGRGIGILDDFIGGDRTGFVNDTNNLIPCV